MTGLIPEITQVYGNDASARALITDIGTQLARGHRSLQLIFDSATTAFTVQMSKSMTQDKLQRCLNWICTQKDRMGWSIVVVSKRDPAGDYRFYLTKGKFNRWCTMINSACCDVPSKIYKMIDDHTKRLMDPDAIDLT